MAQRVVPAKKSVTTKTVKTDKGTYVQRSKDGQVIGVERKPKKGK